MQNKKKQIIKQEFSKIGFAIDIERDSIFLNKASVDNLGEIREIFEKHNVSPYAIGVDIKGNIWIDVSTFK